MWQIFLGSLLLSVVHALIPHHWIPLIAISKSENWNTKDTLFATVVTGFSHMLSTIIIGIIVGFVGISLSESYNAITAVAAPIILLAMGVFYVIMDFRSKHNHHHNYEINNTGIKNKKSKAAIITSLSLAMFFAPCMEIEVFYFQAANFGWTGIFVVSAVYLVVTLLILVALVYLGLKGVNKYNLKVIENHSKLFTGIILIILGFVAYFVEF